QDRPSCPRSLVSNSCITPPPGTPRFPYTTLFRSPTQQDHDASNYSFVAPIATPVAVVTTPLNLSSYTLSSIGSTGSNQWMKGCRDRRSTRLNSSHVSSSYAVFCFKKKNTTAGPPS